MLKVIIPHTPPETAPESGVKQTSLAGLIFWPAVIIFNNLKDWEAF